MTDVRTASGRSTFLDVAPEAARAFEQLVSVRPSGVHDELLQAPAVRAYAAQLREGGPGAAERSDAFDQVTGTHRLAVAQMVWISELAPRLRTSLDALFGASDWPDPRRFPVADVGAVVSDLTRTASEFTPAAPTSPEGVKAAEELVGAVRATPAEFPDGLVARVREHLTDEQAVRVVLETCASVPAPEAAEAAAEGRTG